MRGLERVVLHVGMSKAGSTAIQNALAARRDELLARGVLFPLSVLRRGNPADPVRTPGHLDLVEQLAEGSRTPLQGEWEAAGAGVGTLLLSIENLFNLVEPDRAAGLARLLAGAEVRVVAIVRAQDEWLASRYYEVVTTGQTNELRPFDAYALDALRQGRLDYAARLDALTRRFGASSVAALDHGRLRAQGTLLPAFLEAAGLPLPVPEAEARRAVNASVAYPESVEAHRRLNLVLSSLPQDERYRLAEELKAHYAALAADGVLEARPLHPSRAVRRRVLDAVAEPNRRLSRAHLGGAPFGPGEAWMEAEETVADEGSVTAIHAGGLDAFLRTAERRAQGAATVAVPAVATVTAPAAARPAAFLRGREASELVARSCRRARCALAHGSGWPVLAMASTPGRLVLVIEDDAEAARRLQTRLDRAETASPVVVYPFGMSASPGAEDPAAAIWREPFFRHPDLVLIGARRTAADLATAWLAIERPVTALVDGCEGRPGWAILRPLLPEGRVVDGLAAFELDPADLDAARRRALAGAFAPRSAA